MVNPCHWSGQWNRLDYGDVSLSSFVQIFFATIRSIMCGEFHEVVRRDSGSECVVFGEINGGMAP